MSATPNLASQLADAIGAWGDRRTGSGWITSSQGAVYVRKGVHLIDGRLVTTLDLASIDMVAPGQGHFTRFLEQAKDLNPWDAIYIENVLNPRFAEHLRRSGWSEIPNQDAPCFYLLRQSY